MSGMPPPDDLPKSATGRIPQWVRDEAVGKPVDTPGFRAYSAPEAEYRSTSGPRRGGWVRRLLAMALVIALIVGLGYVAQSFRSGPTQTAAPVTPPHPIDGPMPGHEEAAAPLGAPAKLAAESSSYRFLDTTKSGAPVTWSPCRPIHYVVRTAHQPPGGQKALAQSIAAVSKATGLKFVNDGATTEAPSNHREPYQPEKYGDRWAPVLITWATADEVPDFGVDIVGEAGPVTVTSSTGSKAFVSGSVALDAAAFTEMTKVQGSATARSVIEHELGHLVGLAHVNDSRQLMFPRAGKVTSYQAGDLTGLAKLGQGPCQPGV